MEEVHADSWANTVLLRINYMQYLEFIPSVGKCRFRGYKNVVSSLRRRFWESLLSYKYGPNMYVYIAYKWYSFTHPQRYLSLLSVRSNTTYGTYFRLYSRYPFLLPCSSNSPATLSQKSNRQGSYGSGVNRAYPL